MEAIYGGQPNATLVTHSSSKGTAHAAEAIETGVDTVLPDQGEICDTPGPIISPIKLEGRKTYNHMSGSGVQS